MGHRFGSFHQIFHEKGDKEKGNKVDEFASLLPVPPFVWQEPIFL